MFTHNLPWSTIYKSLLNLGCTKIKKNLGIGNEYI